MLIYQKHYNTLINRFWWNKKKKRKNAFIWCTFLYNEYNWDELFLVSAANNLKILNIKFLFNSNISVLEEPWHRKILLIMFLPYLFFQNNYHFLFLFIQNCLFGLNFSFVCANCVGAFGTN